MRAAFYPLKNCSGIGQFNTISVGTFIEITASDFRSVELALNTFNKRPDACYIDSCYVDTSLEEIDGILIPA